MQDGTPEDTNSADVVSSPRHDAYSALRIRDFRLVMTGTVVANLGMQMQEAAIGWEIYERTGSAFMVGLVGLSQVVPVIALVLPAGHVADRFDRRRIIMAMLVLIGVCSVGLTCVSHYRASVLWMYVLLFVLGMARAFLQPARASLLPQIVPRELFSNAVTWNSGGFHLACVAGPAVGGWLIAMFGGAMAVYVLASAAVMMYFVLMAMIEYRPEARQASELTAKSLVAGLAFLRRSPLVFGTITLDMFAVLLGGATTLLPIYAKDILHVGPVGFGWLRASPAVGALAMSFILAHRRPMNRAGPAMLWSVAGFGVATVVFGLSRSYWLSLCALAMTGMLDNISVVIRHTLVQLSTPDEMRGRVSAINSMFIGASNELGGFESGAVAALFTPTISVVSGGIGALVVVVIAAIACPPLRRYGRLGST